MFINIGKKDSREIVVWVISLIDPGTNVMILVNGHTT